MDRTERDVGWKNELVRNMLMRPLSLGHRNLQADSAPLSNGNPYLTPARLMAAKITNLAPGHRVFMTGLQPESNRSVTMALTTFKRSHFSTKIFSFLAHLCFQLCFDCLDRYKAISKAQTWKKVFEYSMQCTRCRFLIFHVKKCEKKFYHGNTHGIEVTFLRFIPRSLRYKQSKYPSKY